MSVYLQAIVGGDRMIYRKEVAMPILPLGSCIQTHDDLLRGFYIAGYCYVNGHVIVNLFDGHDAYHRPEKIGEPAGLAFSYTQFDTCYKKPLIEFGFLRTGYREHQQKELDSTLPEI